MSDIQKLLDITDGYLNYEGSSNATTQGQMQEYLTNQNVVLKDVVSKMWQPTTTYSVGDRVFSPNMGAGVIAEVLTAGTSGTTEPDWGNLGSNITDNTVTWTMIKYATTANAQPLNSLLTAFSGLTTASNKLPYFSGNNTMSTTDISDFAKTFLDDTDAATLRSTIGATAANCGGIVDSSLTNNGYVKFANGLIIQWNDNDKTYTIKDDNNNYYIRDDGFRKSSTAYTVGDIAYHASLPTGWYLECTTAGTTDAGELVITSPSVGDIITDGTVVWTVHNVYTLYGGALNGKKGIFNGINNSQIVLAGGSGTSSTERCGAKINLYGEDHENNPGFFELLVKNSNANKWLVAKPDGTLQWAGNDLAGSAIVVKSLSENGYTKYASGLIVQWGRKSISGNGNSSVNLPISFATNYVLLVDIQTTLPDQIFATGVKDGLSQILIYHKATSTNFNVYWFAIGY